MSTTAKRYVFFWLSYAIGYLFPFVYFFTRLGITKKATSIVMPTVLLAFLAIVRLCAVIPVWVSTWRPRFLKGIVKSIPIYLLFIVLITLGFTLKYIINERINTAQLSKAFAVYFETVIVLFGGLCVSSVFNALHLKYKELDLMEKGYVLGVVNK